MLDLNKIKQGILIKINNEPYIVIKTEHHKMARGGAVLKTKLKNLINDSVINKTFQGNEKVESAETEKKKANFLYLDKDNVYFMNNETYDQFSISIDKLGGQEKYLKEGVNVNILYFNNKPISIELPVKIELKVIISPPGVKGNSAGNVTKQVELETGLKINVPMFINKGDIIRINTETGEYSERV